MKKLAFVAIALIAMAGTTSCNKNYTCTCTYNGNVVYEGEAEGKRDKVDSDCATRKTTVLGQTWDCDIK